MARAVTVFVVDDDALVTTSLGKALELETDYRVLTFNDGPSALAEMAATPPDVVLSDVKMPGLDGLSFLRQVRQRHPDAVLLLITGYADKESAIRAINEVGLWQYVEKPWDLGDLLIKIAQGIERQHDRTALADSHRELATRLDQLERAQEELVRAERLAAVGRVASGLAHEIGNQLALVGYAEAIRERTADPEVAEFAAVIVAAQRRLAALVDEIKDFARGASATYEREPADLAATVEEAVALLRFDPDVKGRPVRVEAAARPLASLHRGKITQLVINLVQNAAQASPPGEAVVVRVDADGTHAQLSVLDRGPGIPAEVRARLGEPFFTTKERGSGLGIGISRRVAADHGGSLEHLARPGGGTEARLRLPLIGQERALR
jgi:signal transduction histidine kinase